MSGIAGRIARGASWLYAYRWAERLLDFLSIVILARILAPEDFGLVAIAASIVAIVEGLAAFDVNKALIRSRDEARELLDSAWTLSILRGLLAALVMVAVLPFLSDGRIAAVLLALSLGPVLTGLSNPRFVLFERDLVYSKLAWMTLGAKVGAFCVTVGLALLFRSYWALVAGILAGIFLATLLSYALEPYRPRFSTARAGEIFSFSGWLSLTTIVTTLSMETDKLIVGRWLGVADAGRYFMTQRVGVLPTRELVSPLQRILFPSFSELRHDAARLRRAVAESIRGIASLSLPAGCGFALVAADFVPLVLGDRWAVIVPLLAVLTPYLGLRATVSVALPCAMALGRVRLLFWVSLAYALVHVPLFIAATIRFGLTGAIWSLVVAGVLYIGLSAWLIRVTVGVSFGEILCRLRRPLVATGVMIIGLLTVGRWLGAETAHPSWLALLGRVALGGLLYAGTLYAQWRLDGRPDGIERRLADLTSQLRDRWRSR